jgi:hypothetical protein
MSELNINTGIELLDDDLRAVFEAVTPKKRQAIIAAIGNYDLSKSEFFEIVPQAIFRVVAGFRNPSGFKSLLEKVNEESRPHLERAREIAEQHFADILKHPAIMPLAAGNDDDDDHLFSSEVLNTITKIRHMPQWKGQPPQMCPASRVAFFGLDQNLLLDSVFDWDDYLYVTETLLKMLICEMKSGKALADLGQVELPYKTEMRDRIQSLEKHVGTIKELCAVYRLNASGADEPIVSKTQNKSK